ncbi:MAG: hypothetical protein NC081_12120 [Roseburia sp.]|nr:hypothetical protein [Roseburia sp.]
MNGNTFLQDIDEADMILVGLGEEFNGVKALKDADEGYSRCREKLEEEGCLWMLPAYQARKRREAGVLVASALGRLLDKLEGKNYFVVSVATDSSIAQLSWRDNRFVMPCGGASQKQCIDCENSLAPVTREDERRIGELFLELEQNGTIEQARRETVLGRCPHCGRAMVLNNVYCENYDESGYLENWERYMKWLQGSLNHRLLVLELGVGMQFPSVIRWPFEKAAFFNNKAKFYRVNENLYQLTEELKGKGVSISENAIDWLSHLC